MVHGGREEGAVSWRARTGRRNRFLRNIWEKNRFCEKSENRQNRIFGKIHYEIRIPHAEIIIIFNFRHEWWFFFRFFPFYLFILFFHAGNGGVIYTQVMWCNLYINLLFYLRNCLPIC